MCNAQNSLPLALFTELLMYERQPESVTQSRKRNVIFNGEIKTCNAATVQKLMKAFYSFRNRKEDKLAIVRGNQGCFGIR